MKDKILVFGSNLAGRHGKGAALYAKQHHGAIYGKGEGIQGSSYAIPTKDHNLKTLPLDSIEENIKTFKEFARNNLDLVFNITRVGCGLAGCRPYDISLMFKDSPPNCILPHDFDLLIVDIYNEINQ